MRETYSTLLQTTQDLCIDDATTSATNLSDSKTFLERQINDAIQYLYTRISNYKTQPLPQTFSTVANQIFYHIPPGLMATESITIAVGDINYPLKPINSQAMWDKLQQLDITSSDIPQYYFMRQYDFGIYPKPGAVYTGTIVGNFLPQRISEIDYIAGTVTIAQNSTTVTGTNTVFTAGMVGRWLRAETGGRWYKIKTFNSSVSLTLETSFQEPSVSTVSYTIGQSPEVPEELHQYIPYRAAANYYATVRRDVNQAQALTNYFYTGDYANNRRGGGIQGGVMGTINRYKNRGRSNTQLNTLHKSNYVNQWRDEAWATTLSPAS
jgi:hypothetical protein